MEHGVLDNLEFPFWSLRDIMIYSAPRDLKGNLWKRGSSGLGWTKRNYDIHGTADKVTLNKFLKDDDELDANEIMDEIMLFDDTWFWLMVFNSSVVERAI